MYIDARASLWRRCFALEIVVAIVRIVAQGRRVSGQVPSMANPERLRRVELPIKDVGYVDLYWPIMRLGMSSLSFIEISISLQR